MAEYNISARLSLKDQMTAKLNSAIKATERLARGVGDAKDRDINYKIGVKGMEQLKRYQEMLKSAGMTQPKPVNLRVNDNGATSKIAKIKTDLQGIAGKAWNTTLNIKTNGAQALGKVKNNLSELATGAAFGLGAGMLGTAGIGYGAVNMVQSYMDFEKQMSAVQAIIGYDKSQMGALNEEAKRIGYTTKFTAADAAKAMYYQGMAGWREEQMLAGTQGIVNLAAAGNVDLATSSDIVTDLMTGFGLKAGEQIRLAGKPIQEASMFFDDSMAALITSANTDLVQAKEALKYSAPIVQAMYADKSMAEKAQAMQDAFVITGLMANAGVKGSQAGTSQRALFTRLASENRNAYFAERALPVSLVDETTGEVRRLRDVVSDFREKFQNGLDAEAVTSFAEAISGEKIHADTRRKLNSFIENVQKNGGKMTGADKLKMTSMLSGQEAMSGWLSVFLASEEDWNKLAANIDNAAGKAEQMAEIQTDNLAGDITKLGSAWEGLNIALMEGSASSGLRDFTKGVTDFISKGIDLMKDGFQFTDIFALIGTAIDKLKNKFLEFDGVGSILAGGALFMGLKKIASLALGVKDTLSAWSKARTAGDIGDLIRGNKTPPIGTSQVGTMHVNAGVVNLNGTVKGGLPPANQRGATVGGTNARTRSQQYADDYYRRRETILAQRQGSAIPPNEGAATRAGAMSVLRGVGGAIAGAGVLSAVFGALDVYSARSQSKISNEAAAADVVAQQKILAELQSSANASQDEIAAQMLAVSNAVKAQKEIALENANVERTAEFGAGGAVAGAMAGAALGSFVPIIGTAIGGIIGGILGQMAGVKAAESVNAMATVDKGAEIPSIPAGSVAEFRGADTGTLIEYRNRQQPEVQAQQADNALVKYADSMAKRQAADRAELKGARIIDNDSKLEQARQNLHSAGYQYELSRQRAEENAAVANRENYFANERAKQQKMLGGQYQGEIAPYKPKDERERAALASYDSRKENEMRLESAAKAEEIAKATAAANKSWRDMEKPTFENAKTTFQAATDFKNASSEYQSRQKAFSDAFTNNDGKGFFDSIKDFFSGIKTAAADFGDDLLFSKAAAATPDSVTQPATFEPAPINQTANVETQGVFDFEMPNIGEMIGNWFSNFELPELGITEKIQAEFEGASAIFDNFVMTAQTSFSNLGTGIQGALEGAKSAITTAFNDASAQVQSTWSAMPGFFGGVFAGLGGVASAAGSAIYSGLTSVIGGIIGAWQSAASTISGIISSISAAASSAASAAGNFFGGGIGSNATGTASWRGGWTEVNEHGGEIINLPRGTQIIPHATTERILRKEINQRLDSGADNYHGIPFEKYGFVADENINMREIDLPKINSQTPLAGDVIKPNTDFVDGWRKNKIFTRDTVGRIFNRGSQSPLSGDVIKPDIPTARPFKLGLPRISMPDLTSIFNTFGGDVSLPNFDLPNVNFDLPNVSNGGTTNNQSSSNTLNINGVTINNGANQDELFFHLQQMISLAAVNSEFA